jgi:hypothetical protein
MIDAIPATELAARPYFNRYTDNAIDLCDVLSSFSSQAKVSRKSSPPVRAGVRGRIQ